MQKLLLAVGLLVLLSMIGCARVTGPYYMEQEQYEEGIRVLGQQFRENPEDAPSAYYVGRYYLALNQPKTGLEYLEKAVQLDPENADYVFWTGVAHWAMLDFKREQEAYKKALALNPNHISANLYLGHGYLDQGEWAKALAQYDRVIELDAYNPEALYDRAVALGELDKTEEEVAAWKKFLEFYPDGSLALEGTERLNLLGDFTYRNVILGQRNVTLRSVEFKPETSALEAPGRESLHVMNAMLKENAELAIYVVVYVNGNVELAKRRAVAIRDYMLNGHRDISSERLPLSWFGTAEIVELGGETHKIDESVQFITVTR